MFDELSEKLEIALKSLRGEDKLNIDNITPALKTVRKALLDADVSLAVVDEFLGEVRENAIGKEVVKGIRPEQKFVEVIHNGLVEVLGERNEPLKKSDKKPTVVVLVGLQGAGKTTATAKLGLYCKQSGQKVLLVGADTFRPAAKEQLIKLGEDCGVDVFTKMEGEKSLYIAEEGLGIAKKEDYDIVIIDTAGRLYIDTDLMEELKSIKEYVNPDEVLLVVDSMIGQEAAELTRAFNDSVGISGAILTKLDGDSRGGAALSIKKVSGKPIKFIGTGEKIAAFEAFHPERIASRILGMGDILTLVDKAQKEVEIEDVLKMQKKFEEATFDFGDFLQQMKLIKRMGSIGGLMKLIPGMNRIDSSALKAGERQLQRIQAMIGSMTEKERKDPDLLLKSLSRRKRVASGSGYSEVEVEKVLTDFGRMKKMMQGLARGNLGSLQGMVTQAQGTRFPQQEARSKETIPRKEQKKRKGFFEL